MIPELERFKDLVCSLLLSLLQMCILPDIHEYLQYLHRRIPPNSFMTAFKAFLVAETSVTEWLNLVLDELDATPTYLCCAFHN